MGAIVVGCKGCQPPLLITTSFGHFCYFKYFNTNKQEKETMTSWANRGKAAIAAVPTGKNTAPRRGERFEGVIDKVESRTFNKSEKNPYGSFGLVIKYAVKSQERASYENIILYTLDGKGGFTPTKYGKASLDRRLLAAGLTSQEILGLPDATPLATAAIESLDKALTGASVAVYLADETYMNATGQMVTKKGITGVSALG